MKYFKVTSHMLRIYGYGVLLPTSLMTLLGLYAIATDNPQSMAIAPKAKDVIPYQLIAYFYIQHLALLFQRFKYGFPIAIVIVALVNIVASLFGFMAIAALIK
jgi:hypothetical protein